MPADLDALRADLERLDGRGYGGYKRLRDGRWAWEHGELAVVRVQADPFAPPSRLQVRVPPEVAGLPDDLLASRPRRRGVADALVRATAAALGTGRDAPFSVDIGGQQVLARSAIHVAPDGAVTLRLAVALPADGRRIRGRHAADLLTRQLPAAVAQGLRWTTADHERVRAGAEVCEDAAALRGQLGDLGLVAFVADGAVLPRRSGVDDRPLTGSGVVPFAAPTSLARTVTLPNAGAVTGMGVPEGVTVVVGGGYHGKSTLLRALERGVYDHVPGDGRERCVTRPDAVAIRAEDGRRVARVDVSPFVGALPTGASTADFSSEDASGSTSQAAATVEALEAGADALLIDEDTAATNLMVRDVRMQRLVAAEAEPLTPFTDLARSLHRDRGVSTVLVAGGSGDAFDVADTVIRLHAFTASEVTGDAHAIAAAVPGREGAARAFPPVPARVPDPASVPVRHKGKPAVTPRGAGALRVGPATVDLAAVNQLVDPSLTAGVGQALRRLVEDGLLDGSATLAEALAALAQALGEEPAEALAARWAGDVAAPRHHEVAAALNRLRTLEVRAPGAQRAERPS